jgi:hypothetical protein
MVGSYVIREKGALLSTNVGVTLMSDASSNAETDRKRAGLLGQVRSIRHMETRFSVTSGKWSEPVSIFSQDASYDPSGNRTLETGYNTGFLSTPNVLVELYKNQYQKCDDCGNVIEEGLCRLDGSIVSRWTYFYNQSGGKIQEDFYFPPGLLSRQRFYDDQGKTLREITYSLRGSITERTLFKYDTGHNVVEQTIYANGGCQFKSIYAYEFDAIGNWVRRLETRIVVTDGIQTKWLHEIQDREIYYY